MDDRSSLWIAAPLLALTVLAACGIAFPTDFLLGTAPHWTRATGDAAQHVIGGRYFTADAWRLPLLFVPTLGLPDGTNIGLTDSVPVAALIAKLGRGLWGAERIYLPAWILACWALQGVAGAIALHVAGVRRVAPLILGGLLLVFTPVLLARFGHAALSAHFLLLLALAIHLRAIRAPAGHDRGGQGLDGGLPAHDHAADRVWLLYPPLLVLALLTHVYLLAMVAGFALATLLHGLWTERLGVGGLLVRLAAMALPVAATLWLIGYFALGPMPFKAYGEWPLNLAAPLWPGWSLLTGMPGEPAVVGFESYAWPGAGMLLLVVLALVGARARLRPLLAAHGATLTAMLAVLIFAATFAVRLGPWTILGLPLQTVRNAVIAGSQAGGTLHRLLAALTRADWVRAGLYGLVLVGFAGGVAFYLWRTRRRRALAVLGTAVVAVAAAAVLAPHAVALVVSNFQGSARFVWMPGYLLAVLAIAGVWRAFRPPVALACLGVALLLQVADTEPLWARLRAYAVEQPPALPDAAMIDAEVAAAHELVLVPTYLCAYAEGLAPAAEDALVDRITQLELAASRTAVPINSVRTSRMSSVDQAGLAARCAAARDAARDDLRRTGRLTVVLAGAPAEETLLQELATDPACTRSAVGLLCRGGGAEPSGAAGSR